MEVGENEGEGLLLGWSLATTRRLELGKHYMSKMS